jgi:hypothetical protein
MENKNFTEEELKLIDSLREEYESLVIELGINETQLLMLNHKKEILKNKLFEIQQKEQDILDKLNNQL